MSTSCVPDDIPPSKLGKYMLSMRYLVVAQCSLTVPKICERTFRHSDRAYHVTSSTGLWLLLNCGY